MQLEAPAAKAGLTLCPWPMACSCPCGTREARSRGRDAWRATKKPRESRTDKHLDKSQPWGHQGHLRGDQAGARKRQSPKLLQIGLAARLSPPGAVFVLPREGHTTVSWKPLGSGSVFPQPRQVHRTCLCPAGMWVCGRQSREQPPFVKRVVFHTASFLSLRE